MTLENFTSEVLPLKDRLFRYAKSILNNADEAKDAVQETMLKVWEKGEQTDSIRNIEAWCMTVVRNAALSKYRLKDNQNQRLEQGDEVEENTDSPYQKMERLDMMSKIDKLVSALPLKLKEVFQLRDVEGYSYSEISEITGYQLSDVKVSVFRARKTMREKLVKIYSYEKYG